MTPTTDALYERLLKENPGNLIYLEEMLHHARQMEQERDGLKYLLQQISRGNNRLYEINKYLLIELIASRNERDEAREERDNLKQELEIVTARLHGKKHPLDNGIPERHEVYIFKNGKYELDT